jgi:hypothetical protein
VCRDVDMLIITVSLFKINMNNRRSYTKTFYFPTRFSTLILHERFQPYRLRDGPTSITFNNCTLCPNCIYVFCIYLRTNSDLYHLQHKLVGFYNRDEKCLQRGTDWVFKYSSRLRVYENRVLRRVFGPKRDE